MTKMMKEMQTNHEKRMEELTQSRHHLQNQIEIIGTRLLNVLDLFEQKLKDWIVMFND